MNSLQQDPSPILEFRNLNVWFEGRHRFAHVVKDVNFSIRPGELMGLVGESGSGKTTTILAAMGLLPAAARVSGEILLGDRNILAYGPGSVAQHRWKDIAMVFQGAMNALNPVKSISWQIGEAIRAHTSFRGEDIRRRTAELLDLVGISAASGKNYPHQFSGGMRQRAVMAMALACNPRILLADEPTTALDVIVQDQILKLLARLAGELRLAVVMVTHDLGVVGAVCQRAAVMRHGAIVEQAVVPTLFSQPRHSYTRELFSAIPSLSAAAETRPPPPEDHAPLLEARDVSVVYQRTVSPGDLFRRRQPQPMAAVNNFSLAVGYGELVALVGQSGSGKTTTLQAVLGMVPVTQGSVRIGQRETTALNARAWRPLRRRVQMIYQDPYESLDSRYRVKDIIEEPLLIHGIGATARERLAMIEDVLKRTSLTPAEDFLYRYPHELSGGQRQRVAIAASLILKPELLLADEPVSMLDVSVRTGILALLDDLRRTERMGILMITHDLSTAAKYADRILVMHEGRIVEAGPTREVILSPKADYTRHLLACIPDIARPIHAI